MSFIDTITHLPEDIHNAFHSVAASFDLYRVTPMETPIVDPSHVSVAPDATVETASKESSK